MATPMTHEEAVAHKQEVEAGLTATVKTWHVLTEPNPTSAVNFLNLHQRSVKMEEILVFY